MMQMIPWNVKGAGSKDEAVHSRQGRRGNMLNIEIWPPSSCVVLLNWFVFGILSRQEICSSDADNADNGSPGGFDGGSVEALRQGIARQLHVPRHL